MIDKFSRTELLIGPEALKKLNNSKVAIYGVGGVGSYVVEALARCGVGNFILVDDDTISITNINRQIHSTTKTIGMSKVEVMKQRILDINPDAIVETYQTFITNDNINQLVINDCNYIVDAIDTISAKIALVVKANELNIPIMSSMGAGNKLDPTRFEIADIYDTSICPVAKVMRHELRKRNIEALKVVFSKEEPIKARFENEESKSSVDSRKRVPGSISFVPSVVGLIIASEVVKDLIK